jgi:hypothetical protein
MPAHNTLRKGAKVNLNHLRRGVTYRAVTASGAATGKYIGMEEMYGDRAILLRSAGGYESIYQLDIVAIEPVAA